MENLTSNAGKVAILFRCSVPNNKSNVDAWWQKISGQTADSTESGRRVILMIPTEELDLLERTVAINRKTPQNTYCVVLPPARRGGMDRIIKGTAFADEETKRQNGGGCSVPLVALPSQIDQDRYPGGI